VNFFPYPGESGGATGADEAAVLAAVKQAGAQCDFLVVSIHWGVEYATAPRPEDVDMAHKMLERGQAWWWGIIRMCCSRWRRTRRRMDGIR